MFHRTLPRHARPAAVNASTVFAVTLAIVAGLIFAWVAKVALFDRKPVPPAAEAARYKVTVAAVNILDKQQVLPEHVKTIQVSREKYDEYLRAAREMDTRLLEGNQPVNRTTAPGKTIRAEEPFFESSFDPLGYPVSVEKLLQPGKRAIILEVPAREVMVQVGDVVDVFCTLSNDNPVFGPAGSSATAALARGLRVVARFNTTRPAAMPPPGPNRTFTLEVEPWQFAVLELARAIGGAFSLGVAGGAGGEGGSDLIAPASTRAGGADESFKTVEAHFNATGRVTVADLALLFGVEEPPAESVHRLERMRGNEYLPTLEYPNYAPAGKSPTAPRSRPPAARPAVRAVPGGPVPARPPAATPASSPPRRLGRTPAAASAVASAVAAGNHGFRPVSDSKWCATGS